MSTGKLKHIALEMTCAVKSSQFHHITNDDDDDDASVQKRQTAIVQFIAAVIPIME